LVSGFFRSLLTRLQHSVPVFRSLFKFHSNRNVAVRERGHSEWNNPVSTNKADLGDKEVILRKLLVISIVIGSLDDDPGNDVEIKVGRIEVCSHDEFEVWFGLMVCKFAGLQNQRAVR
jgi:hypothetical protein